MGKIAPEAYELPQGFAIVVLKSREDADVSKYDEARAQIVEDLTYQKGVARLSDWLKKRCEQASKSGSIKVNSQLFAEGQDDQGAERAGYQACATLDEFAGGQLRGRRSF